MVPMAPIVFFDLMGTVLADPYRRAIEAATRRPLVDVARERDPDAWPAFESGAIDEAAFARRFYADGRPFDVATFHRVRRAGYRYLPGMRELLDELAGRAERHLATNYPSWVDELLVRFGLHARLEAVWASCRLGVRKPDPAFYERMLAGASPARCLLVDDRLDNCLAAEAWGLAAHHFVGADDLRGRLRAEGLLSG